MCVACSTFPPPIMLILFHFRSYFVCYSATIYSLVASMKLWKVLNEYVNFFDSLLKCMHAHVRRRPHRALSFTWEPFFLSFPLYFGCILWLVLFTRLSVILAKFSGCNRLLEYCNTLESRQILVYTKVCVHLEDSISCSKWRALSFSLHTDYRRFIANLDERLLFSECN